MADLPALVSYEMADLPALTERTYCIIGNLSIVYRFYDNA